MSNDKTYLSAEQLEFIQRVNRESEAVAQKGIEDFVKRSAVLRPIDIIGEVIIVSLVVMHIKEWFQL